MTNRLRLGVNIDHVATVRNARGGAVPDPVRAAVMAEEAGAGGSTPPLPRKRRPPPGAGSLGVIVGNEETPHS